MKPGDLLALTAFGAGFTWGRGRDRVQNHRLSAGGQGTSRLRAARIRHRISLLCHPHPS